MGIKYEKGTFIVIPNKETLKGQPAVLQTLYMWICSFADEKGLCWPSRVSLAEKSGIGEKTVDKYIKKLIDLGLIIKETRKNEAKNLTNVYQIMIVEGVGNVIPQGTKYPRVGNNVPQGGERSAPGVGNETTQELNTVITNTNEPNSLSSAFEEFYELYPLKKAKKIAEGSWFKLNPPPELIRLILDDIKIRKVKDRGWLDGYIPMPSTYLNQERWNDDITPQRTSSVPMAPGTPYVKGKYINDRSIEV